MKSNLWESDVLGPNELGDFDFRKQARVSARRQRVWRAGTVAAPLSGVWPALEDDAAARIPKTPSDRALV